jgi:Cu(I)/Ag(I) efflux system membrane fusion protein
MTDNEVHLQEGEEAPPRGVKVMAFVRWMLVLAMAGVATSSVLYYAGVIKIATSSKLYSCVMHPQIVQDYPGECPICGMTLTLKDEGAEKVKPGDGGGEPAPQQGPGMDFCPMHPEQTSSDPPHAVPFAK